MFCFLNGNLHFCMHSNGKSGHIIENSGNIEYRDLIHAQVLVLIILIILLFRHSYHRIDRQNSLLLPDYTL